MYYKIKNLSIVSLIALSTLFCSCKKHVVSDKDVSLKQFCIPDSLMKQITIDTVSLKPVIQEYNLIGKVSYDQDKVVKLFPMVSGNVLEVNVALGDYVIKGQVLAKVKSVEIAGAENDIVTAQANLAIAEKNLIATENMYKSGVSSEKEYLESLKEVEKARSEFHRVKTVLSIYGGSQSIYIVKSPISGYIVEKFINPDMQIRPDNTTNLFTISDLKKVWVLANVYESDIANINVGEEVSITTVSYPDKKFNGKIDKIYNMLDPDNKTMKVRVQLDNSDALLKPEMFANVTVRQVKNNSMLAVPAKSVIFDRDKYWVIVYTDKCNVKIKQVEIMKTTSLFTYIRSGMKPGEKVITNLQLLIYDALNQ